MGTVTISGSTFFVFGTLAEANTYMSARIGAEDWLAASTANKSRAMVTATRWINRTPWPGAKTDPAQDGAFPRTGLTCEGVAVPDDEIPVNVEHASYELALVVLEDAEAQGKSDTGSNIRRVMAGQVQVEFFRGTSGKAPVFPSIPLALLRCYMGGSFSSTMEAYGTDVCPYDAGTQIGRPLA